VKDDVSNFVCELTVDILWHVGPASVPPEKNLCFV